MRAAGNYGVDEVIFTGTRYQKALASNPNIPNISRRISEGVLLNGVECLLTSLSSGTRIVCVEFAENAIALPSYQHPENACYIFGPEDGSLSQSIIDKADDVVYIPTHGCMNLAATVNVLLYDRMLKSSQIILDNTLIQRSRDTNNNLKVRDK